MAFSAPFQSVFRAPLGGGAAAAPAAWYNAGGAPNPVAAYRFKGAASYAAAKVNLVTPGTHDAVDGAAFPSWNAATGCAFDDTLSQYLTTDVVVAANAWTTIIQFANAAGNIWARLCGASDDWFVRYFFSWSTGGAGASYRNGSVLVVAPVITAGNLCMAGATAYRDGVNDGIIPVSAVPAAAQYIGAMNEAGAPMAGTFLTGDVIALAYYDVTLSAPQVAAVKATMAAF